MPKKDNFTFAISLSVLNHLGRNLYRSFITVLGEAISNAWDADAENVWIYIDKAKNNFVIKDNGDGMSKDDFQNKFLKIGYSKRKDGKNKSRNKRPFIGRKGIGKLALLSCASKITVISKIKGGDYVGGVIDNSSLDDAITEDLTPQEYRLGYWQSRTFAPYMKNHEKGTIIHFEAIDEGIINTVDYLKMSIALYFKFSLLDNSFNIYVNDELITLDHLKRFAEKTQFCWNINNLADPYVDEKLTKLLEKTILKKSKIPIKGFIASVELPRHLKIRGTDERISVDLFVNGRLREKDILKRIPTQRVIESYLYGQIHYNALDDKADRFTSSREGIVPNDPKFAKFLDDLKSVISAIFADWDRLRRKYKKDGDPEDISITKKQRKSEELYYAVSEEYALPEDSESTKTVYGWVDELGEDASFNFSSYAECFISENLIRKYIKEKNIKLSNEAKKEVKRWIKKEQESKGIGGISIDLRKENINLSYLSMDGLANLVDKRDPNREACLSRDAREYKPIRDALMHTALLTDRAKWKLTTVYENIKGRIITLLSAVKPNS